LKYVILYITSSILLAALVVAFVKKKAVWAMETNEVSGCHAVKLGKGGTSELCRYHANCESVLSNLITRN
jgi:hypothetical protein